MLNDNMLKISIKSHLPIIGILLLSALLRLIYLDQVPLGFYTDEAAIGYDAYSILKTGRDHWGNFLPLFARSFGDYDEATYRYLVVPTVWLFGLTEFATRLPAALAGILTVWAIYLLGNQLFDKRTALLIALFLAISPWHILMSRWAVRAILLPLFFCLGLATFLKGLQKPKQFIVSALLFAISLHTYNSARVFVPLFIAGLVWLYRKPLWQHRHYTLPSGLLFALILGYLFTFWISPQGMQRAQSTLTTDITALPAQYLSYLNPRFLFWRGDDNPRHSILPMGQLHHLEIITICLGIYGLIKSQHKHKKIILLWLILYPIPAALTASTHAIRAIMGTLIFAILSGYGIHTLYMLFQAHKRLLSLCVSLSIVTTLAIFGKFYFIDYPKMTAYWWYYGMGQAIKLTETYPYPCIIEHVQGLLYIFVLFYAQFPPETYHSLPQEFKEKNWEDISLGKYTITGTLKFDVVDQGIHLFIAGQQMETMLKYANYEYDGLHTIKDPSGRGILLKILMTTGQKTP